MPKKINVVSLPSDAEIIDVPVSEIPSFLFVMGKALPDMVKGTSHKYWANLRCEKRGPPFFMTGPNGGSPAYRIRDVVNYLTRRPVKTFNEQ
ncbi:MAG: hypothetical protein H8E42_02730 [Nitrospinae bacterium]|nr:hypothetical protein [Nitrospinota bacterium]